MNGRLGMTGNSVVRGDRAYGLVTFAKAKLVPVRTPFLHPSARPFHANKVNQRAGLNQNVIRHREGFQARGSMTSALAATRTAPAGPRAPAKTLRALSGPDYESTISRIGRATRRQGKEFGSLVHPLSGRVIDMRRGDSLSAGYSMGALTRRKSTERLAHMADNAKNFEVRQRAKRQLLGQNINTKGPQPVFVHNHPNLSEHHGVKGRHGVRHHPSSTDLNLAAMTHQSRHVVLSHDPKGVGGKHTRAVTTRLDPNNPNVGDTMQRIGMKDFATLPKTRKVRRELTRGGSDVWTAMSMRRMAQESKPGRGTHDQFSRALTGSKKAAETSGIHQRTTFHKSYVPGIGYVSASRVPKSALRTLAHGERKEARQMAAARARTDSARFRNNERENKQFTQQWGSYHGAKGRPVPRTVPREVLGEGVAGFMVKTGGRKVPGKPYVRPGSSWSTHVHETEHATPKRTSYRINHQIARNPEKAMREEGRVDFRSGVDYKHKPGDSGYAHAAGSRKAAEEMRWNMPIDRAQLFEPTPLHRYRQVQDKMRSAQSRRQVKKVDTTMGDREAKRIAARYDTRGPLPKGLSREQKMKAYEGRYIAAGGKQGEKWKKRADRAEVGRNIGLAGVTGASAMFVGVRSHKVGPKLRALKHIGPKMTKHNAEMGAAGSAVLGGGSELYGEHARSRRASYANSPAGVAGSALTRMQAYTPTRRTS